MRYVFWTTFVLIIIARILFQKPDFSDGQKIRISSKVDGEPIRYETSQMFYLEGLRIYLPTLPEIYYGDFVIVEGVVEEKNLKDAVLVERLESSGMLYKFRRKMLEVYNKSLPEPHASLVTGVVLGSKSSIPRSFWEDLKDSGTAHVVVASGMNVTLVAGFLMNFFLLLIERKKAVFLALVGIWVYAILAGFDAPIIRAAIMGSIAFSAQALGKLYQAWRALVISALLMLIIKPGFISDLGFILSFVATGSLMVFEARIRKRIKALPLFLKEGLSTSLAAQIGVAPILYLTFGQFSLLSPLINALVLWTIAPMTIIGAFGGLVGLVYEPLGKIILYLTIPFTFWFESIVTYV